MWKNVFALQVLIFATLAVAEPNVVLTIVPDANDNGWAAINYAADATIKAFALTVVSNGANIIEVNDFFKGYCDSFNKGYGIFPERENGIYIDSNNVIQDWGNPVADACSPGAAGTGIGTKKIIITMGALYHYGNQPPLSGKLCSIRIGPTPSNALLSVAAESTYRGGVVMEDGTCVDPDVTGATNMVVWNCHTPDPYRDLKKSADNTNPNFDLPDGYIGPDDLCVVLYFWDYNTVDCNSYDEPYRSLCWRADNTDESFGSPDGYISSDDLTTVLYFCGQYVCD